MSAEGTLAPRFEMRGVKKRFGSTTALDGVDFSVAPGEIVALVGENGAGKSTLMNVLSGAVFPDEGEMHLDGAPYRPEGPLEARRRGVMMVHQELALAPHLSVEDNLFLGIESVRLGFLERGKMRERAIQVLSALGHGDIPPAARVGALSPSAQQIVEIARALILEARVLILDEPTSSLPRADVETLFRMIRKLKDSGLAVVYISHFLEEAQEIADRFTVLRDGKTVGHGKTRETPLAEMVRLMVGRTIKEMYPRGERRPGEVVLETERLAGVKLPQEASFTLRRGEILGIAGLVGAGRTELLRALFGLDAVREGEIRVGVYHGPATPGERLAQSVGLLSEDRGREGLALSRSIADNLTLSRLPGSRWRVSPPGMRRAAREFIERLSIRCRHAEQKVAEISGGNQQKVALARLLYHDVDVLLLDEPTRGIDVATKAEVYRILDELVTRREKAVLWVSSYLPELLGMADRIAVLRRGRLGPARPVGELSEHQVLRDCVG
jgi:ribose transport system ATP-binding protein